MPLLILILFIAIPIAEIAVLIKVADIIDLWPTVLLIISTAVIGVWLLRRQGLGAMARAQQTLNAGRLPVDSITDAVGLMLAGAFLLTPGLITDSLGFALLIPAVRHGLAGWLFNKARQSANVKVGIFGETNRTSPFEQSGNNDSFGSRRPSSSAPGGPVIDGEIIEPEKASPDTPDRKNRKSPWSRS